MLIYIIAVILIAVLVGNPFRTRRGNYKDGYDKKKNKRRFK